MQKTYFLDKTIVVASILDTKQRHHVLERYVTMRECNKISSLLANLLAYNGLDVCIYDEIDSSCFEIFDDIIITNSINCINSKDLINRYLGSIPDAKILDIVFDDSVIYNYLCDLRVDDKKLSYVASELDEIVDRVLDNSKVFYESIAHELSDEEYGYLKRKVEIKCCKNCTTNCSNNEEKYICDKWSNDELVGRVKVKKLS